MDIFDRTFEYLAHLKNSSKDQILDPNEFDEVWACKLSLLEGKHNNLFAQMFYFYFRIKQIAVPKLEITVLQEISLFEQELSI